VKPAASCAKAAAGSTWMAAFPEDGHRARRQMSLLTASSSTIDATHERSNEPTQLRFTDAKNARMVLLR